MTRIQVAKFTRLLMHLHYDIRTEGGELLRDGKVHLILPNHPAYVEPPMLCAEFADVMIRPMADEAFFRKRISGWALRLANAILDKQQAALQPQHIAAIHQTIHY